MKKLTKDFYISRNWTVCLEFKIQDAWIGIYWDFNPNSKNIWVCIIPCFPFHFSHDRNRLF